MVSINAPLWFLYCTIQSAHSFPVLAVHYNVYCIWMNPVHGIVCFAIVLNSAEHLNVKFSYFSCLFMSNSSDPLTINVERELHCAGPNLILGLTEVSSWHLGVSYHQGTNSLDGISRAIITDYSKKKKAYSDKQHIYNITIQMSPRDLHCDLTLGCQSQSEQWLAVNGRCVCVWGGLDQAWSVLYSPVHHINGRIHLEF